jgi:hypothetical protein
MGVLDDAIREHLDLKRRHGAQEEELRRQEAEALGPARREVAPADTEDGEQAEVDAAHDGGPELSEVVAEEQPAAAHHDEAPPEPEAVAESEPEAVAPPEPEAVEPEAVEPEPEPEAELEEEPELEPEPEPEPEGELAFEDDDEDEDEPARASDTPTQGFEAVGYDDQEEVVRSHGDELLEDEDEPFDEEDDEGEASAADADVLEDTPDFLQETPEHDRLWFEQKPPRDFDFD